MSDKQKDSKTVAASAVDTTAATTAVDANAEAKAREDQAKAAQAAEAKRAADEKKAAEKAEAKRLADEKKAADKAEREAKKEADKQAREEKRAAEKAEKDAAKKAAAEQKAAEAAEKKAAREASKMPEQNGVRRPKTDTKCGKVWTLIETIGEQMGQTPPVAYVMQHGKAQGFDDNTLKTQYARWKKFNGIEGRVATPMLDIKLPEQSAE